MHLASVLSVSGTILINAVGLAVLKVLIGRSGISSRTIKHVSVVLLLIFAVSLWTVAVNVFFGVIPSASRHDAIDIAVMFVVMGLATVGISMWIGLTKKDLYAGLRKNQRD